MDEREPSSAWTSDLQSLTSRRFALLQADSARPPCRAPRRRRGAGWRSEGLVVVEWIAMDSRQTPHVTVVHVRGAAEPRVWTFTKQAAQLTATELPALAGASDGAASPPSPRSGAE